jgi:hypothetical protein
MRLINTVSQNKMPDSRTKLFLSHASEDKPAIADALAGALQVDYDLWYDKYKLTLGDSLLAKISEGLREANLGVVILSRNFFGKKWTQNELDGLFALEEANRKVILPVWHDVGVEEVSSYSPTLAGRLGIRTSEGIPAIVSAIHAAVDAANRTAEFNVTSSLKNRLLSIDGELAASKRSKQLLNTFEGVKIVRDAVDLCMEQVLQLLNEVGKDSEILKFEVSDGLNDRTRRVFCVRLPYKLTFCLDYSNCVVNSAEAAHLSVGLWHDERDMWGKITKRTQLIEQHLYPRIVKGDRVSWRSDDVELGGDQAPEFFVDMMISEVEKAYENNKKGS